MSNYAFVFKERLKSSTKKDVLASKLLEMIFTGLLRDGDTLPSERELCAMFGVSRETVRGAIGIVSAYGLISVSHGSKSRVNRNDQLLARCAQLLPELSDVEINNYDIDTVYESRMVVEAAIARKVASHIDQQGLKKLEVLLKQQKSLFTEPAHFQLSDKRFHRVLAEYCDNDILVKYSEELYSYGLNFRRSVMQQHGSIESSYREHQQIFKALSDGDPEQSEKAMLGHIQSVYESTLNIMKKLK